MSLPSFVYGWTPVPCPIMGGRAWQRGPLYVIVSEQNSGGVWWLHVSCSRAGRMPDYEDLKRVKRDFVGPERDAVEIHSKESEHVNLHPFVRHLWARADGSRVLPDMRQYEPLLGKWGI